MDIGPAKKTRIFTGTGQPAQDSCVQPGLAGVVLCGLTHCARYGLIVASVERKFNYVRTVFIGGTQRNL